MPAGRGPPRQTLLHQDWAAFTPAACRERTPVDITDSYQAKHGSAKGLKCYRRERTKPWYTVIFQLQGIISRVVRSAERPVNTRLSGVAVFCPRGVLRGVKARRVRTRSSSAALRSQHPGRNVNPDVRVGPGGAP